MMAQPSTNTSTVMEATSGFWSRSEQQKRKSHYYQPGLVSSLLPCQIRKGLDPAHERNKTRRYHQITMEIKSIINGIAFLLCLPPFFLKVRATPLGLIHK